MFRSAPAAEFPYQPGLDESEEVVQDETLRDRIFSDQIHMFRLFRHFLLGSLLACHMLVTLCGPCLHGLPGSSHDLSAASKSDRGDDASQSRRDSADRCLICHFFAQGQLPFDLSCDLPLDVAVEPASPTSVAPWPIAHYIPSSPRAPPVVLLTIS